MPIKQLAGLKFARLKPIKHVGFNKGGNAIWECLCDCGNTINVAGGNLGRGVKSCGCLAHDTHTKHGRSADYIFRLWHHVKDRCHNSKAPFYAIYGGRGIKLHPAWHDASTFIRDVIAEIGERPPNCHSLDRIKNELGYAPGNIRWATWKEQANNKRNNRLITWRGKTKTLTQWSEYLGIGCSTLRKRLETKTINRAFTASKQKNQFG